jgi:hypothetical protein
MWKLNLQPGLPCAMQSPENEPLGCVQEVYMLQAGFGNKQQGALLCLPVQHAGHPTVCRRTPTH